MFFGLGLYVESHGVITNCKMNLSEPPPGLNYYPTYKIDDWWDNGAEPIWITAVRQVVSTTETKIAVI